jgi:hypothetical protein
LCNICDTDNYDNAIHFSDENADGLSDFCTIIANKRWCYNNTNNGFSQSVSKTLLDAKPLSVYAISLGKVSQVDLLA